MRKPPAPAGPPAAVANPTVAPSVAPPSAAPPPAAPTSPPPPAPAPGPLVVFTPPREPALIGALTQNGAVYGLAICVFLLIVFLFLRTAIKNHLVAKKSPLSSANGASWAFFAFASSLTFTLVFSSIGQLWTVLPFIGSCSALVVFTFFIFLWLLMSARRVVR